MQAVPVIILMASARVMCLLSLISTSGCGVWRSAGALVYFCLFIPIPKRGFFSDNVSLNMMEVRQFVLHNKMVDFCFTVSFIVSSESYDLQLYYLPCPWNYIFVRNGYVKSFVIKDYSISFKSAWQLNIEGSNIRTYIWLMNQLIGTVFLSKTSVRMLTCW